MFADQSDARNRLARNRLVFAAPHELTPHLGSVQGRRTSWLALSACMTAISTCFAVVFLPANLLLYRHHRRHRRRPSMDRDFPHHRPYVGRSFLPLLGQGLEQLQLAMIRRRRTTNVADITGLRRRSRRRRWWSYRHAGTDLDGRRRRRRFGRNFNSKANSSRCRSVHRPSCVWRAEQGTMAQKTAHKTRPLVGGGA